MATSTPTDPDLRDLKRALSQTKGILTGIRRVRTGTLMPAKAKFGETPELLREQEQLRLMEEIGRTQMQALTVLIAVAERTEGSA